MSWCLYPKYTLLDSNFSFFYDLLGKKQHHSSRLALLIHFQRRVPYYKICNFTYPLLFSIRKNQFKTLKFRIS